MAHELDRLATARLKRRDFMRYAGITAGAGVLAACKKAVSPGAAPSASVSRPPMAKEPGGLQVFDWSGYGNGDYYPGKERQYLWADYQKATGDTPKFILFENDDAGYTKVVSGARYDVIHPCAYRFKDYVDLGAVQPW